MTTTETADEDRLARHHGPRERAGAYNIFAHDTGGIPDTWLFSDGAPVYLGDARLDALLTICLELGAELWSTRRRLGLLEQVLGDGGTLPPGAMDNVRFGDDEQWATRRADFLERLLGAATAMMADTTVKATTAER